MQIKAAGELALRLVFFHPEADLGPACLSASHLGLQRWDFGLLKKKDLSRVMDTRSFVS